MRTKIILHLNPGSSGVLALRAARALIRDGHDDCIYAYEDGTDIYVRKNKASVSAFEATEPGCFSSQSNDRLSEQEEGSSL